MRIKPRRFDDVNEAAKFLQNAYISGLPIKNMVLTAERSIVEIYEGHTRRCFNLPGVLSIVDQKQKWPKKIMKIEEMCIGEMNGYKHAVLLESNPAASYMVEFNFSSPFLDSRKNPRRSRN